MHEIYRICRNIEREFGKRCRIEVCLEGPFFDIRLRIGETTSARRFLIEDIQKLGIDYVNAEFQDMISLWRE